MPVARKNGALRDYQRQQGAEIVALADGADVAGILLLAPAGDAAGQAQPYVRVEFDDVGRREIVRVRSRSIEDLDGGPRGHAHFDARAGRLAFEQEQRVAHGQRPDWAREVRGEG